jgi:hypothetical protein
MEPRKENERVGYTYIVIAEEVREHMARSPEEVLQWVEQMAILVYELQTPEQRAPKYDFKPNKRMPPELLRKDIQAFI